MGDLTSNLSRSEVSCQCGCGFDVTDYELILAVQDSGNFFKHIDSADHVIVIVTSGNRCEKHNKGIGGAPDSQHLYGKAMDYKVKTVKNGETRLIQANELYAFLDGKYPEKYGIGMYQRGRVHLDVRQHKARWNNAG